MELFQHCGRLSQRRQLKLQPAKHCHDRNEHFQVNQWPSGLDRVHEEQQEDIETPNRSQAWIDNVTPSSHNWLAHINLGDQHPPTDVGRVHSKDQVDNLYDEILRHERSRAEQVQTSPGAQVHQTRQGSMNVHLTT